VAERRRGGWAAALLATVVLLTGCGQTENTGPGLTGTPIQNAWAVPATPLRDTAGAPYSFREQTDKPLTLVFFGYTNCPDICSIVMANITSALARLDDDRDKVDVVFVTTDPARDDAEALERYLGAFDESYTGLTGSLAEIKKVAEAFHVHLEKGIKLPSGGYEVVHDDHVFAVDAQDEVPVLWQRETQPKYLANDIDLLLHPED
jgi:protein SCO1/2